MTAEFSGFCPHCLVPRDAITDANDPDSNLTPTEGDRILCFNCGGIAVAEKDGTTRKADLVETVLTWANIDFDELAGALGIVNDLVKGGRHE